MNLDLQDAVMCAAMILQGHGISLGIPPDLPEFQQRDVTQDERMQPGVPPMAIGLFYPVGAHGVLVANQWDILVHEAVHDLEFANHLPLREDWAYFAQAHAYECSFTWQTDCPEGMDQCWVASYTPPAP